MEIGKGKRSFLNGFKEPTVRSTSFFYNQKKGEANRIDDDNKRLMYKILDASPSIRTKDLEKSFHHNYIDYK